MLKSFDVEVKIDTDVQAFVLLGTSSHHHPRRRLLNEELK
jgi:hypothetical protein